MQNRMFIIRFPGLRTIQCFQLPCHLSCHVMYIFGHFTGMGIAENKKSIEFEQRVRKCPRRARYYDTIYMYRMLSGLQYMR